MSTKICVCRGSSCRPAFSSIAFLCHKKRWSKSTQSGSKSEEYILHSTHQIFKLLHVHKSQKVAMARQMLCVFWHQGHGALDVTKVIKAMCLNAL